MVYYSLLKIPPLFNFVATLLKWDYQPAEIIMRPVSVDR